jgi:hypothetical protein
LGYIDLVSKNKNKKENKIYYINKGKPTHQPSQLMRKKSIRKKNPTFCYGLNMKCPPKGSCVKIVLVASQVPVAYTCNPRYLGG